MAVLRRYSGCKLDPDFGVNGVLGLRWKETVIPPPPRTTNAPGWSELLHLLQLPSGRMVLGGTHLDYAHHSLCCRATLGLAGITPDGRVDTAFGDDGFAEARFPEQADGGWVDAQRFYAEQDGSGRTTLVLEGGFANPSFWTLPPREPWPAIARFSEDGELIEAHITSPG
jgi:hypothetical protein